jgi:hypothetical protein
MLNFSSGNFSFLEEDFCLVIQTVENILPGTERVLFIESDSGPYKAWLKESDKDSIEEMRIAVESDWLSSFCRLSQKFAWYRKDELPFETHSAAKFNADLFQEQDATVLAVFLSSTSSSKKDILFIYFREDYGSMLVSSRNKILSTETKSVIGFMMHNTLSQLINRIHSDRKVLTGMNVMARMTLKLSAVHRDKADNQKDVAGKMILEFMNRHMEKCSVNFPRFAFGFTNKAENKIRQYQGSIHELATSLPDVMRYLSNVHYSGGDEKQMIYIDDIHLDISGGKEMSEEKDVTHQITDKPERLVKTIHLLDNLEEASQKLQIKNIPLTGINVGEAMRKPVSAPAITDALKKHRNKIMVLFVQHPEKWSTIRNEFRPVLNMLTPKKIKEAEIA